MKIGSYVRAVRKNDDREFSGKVANVKKTVRGTLVVIVNSTVPYEYNYSSFYVEECNYLVTSEYRDIVMA